MCKNEIEIFQRKELILLMSFQTSFKTYVYHYLPWSVKAYESLYNWYQKEKYLCIKILPVTEFKLTKTKQFTIFIWEIQMYMNNFMQNKQFIHLLRYSKIPSQTRQEVNIQSILKATYPKLLIVNCLLIWWCQQLTLKFIITGNIWNSV